MNRSQNILQITGGLLMVIGALMPAFSADFTVATYCFGCGALAFGGIQFLQRYEGEDVRMRRLRRQQLIGAFMLVVTAALMFCRLYQIAPFRGDEWKIALAIACVFETYTAFRM